MACNPTCGVVDRAASSASEVEQLQAPSMECSPPLPGLAPVWVGQNEVVVAAAVAAVAAAHCGAAPLVIGDAVAEALSHVWRWSQP